VIPLLGIYPKECKPGYNRVICTPMFIAALFTIAKFWEQLRCPTTDEWIKKMYNSVIKKNEIMLFAGKWMELEVITCIEESKAQKGKGHMFSLIFGSWA
jgi:hypothetical protein